MSAFATHLDVDAEITVSELRSEETFDQRLHDHAALRLRRRNDLLGVIVSTERWKSIEETIRTLTAAVEKLEEAAVLSLVERRVASTTYAPVTDDAWTAVESRYDELTRKVPEAEVG
jgi:PHD/YefM family antitoxin component YafN of YafNO toxin-antitoxin module